MVVPSNKDYNVKKGNNHKKYSCVSLLLLSALVIGFFEQLLFLYMLKLQITKPKQKY